MKNSNHIFATILLALGFLALSPTPNVFGVVPPPDGGYPNFTTAEGTNSLKNLTTGSGNTGVGWFSLFTASTANFNTGVGAGTLTLNTGDNNTAMGAVALFLNTTGGNNTAVGTSALLHNDSGFNNTGIGAGALTSNTTANANTAVGVGALGGTTDGGGNTATGALALSANDHGDLNTATGLAALQNNTASNNTAIGAGALNQNTTGVDNTANGLQALAANIDGNLNTAIGRQTLFNNTSGSNNIALGADAGFNITGNNNIDILHSGVAGESGTIRIGNTINHSRAFIAGISGVTVPGGVAVIIDANGQLGTIVSSQRFKDEIKPMDKASEAILALKPVTFCYKKELDPNGMPQFGLVAEEVEKVNPDLVARDAKGEVYTVRYDAVNAMLLNEFLKEHKKVEELKGIVASLAATVKEQAAQIQKVSARVEMSKPAPRVATNSN
jgi:hypothetical protein